MVPKMSILADYQIVNILETEYGYIQTDAGASSAIIIVAVCL